MLSSENKLEKFDIFVPKSDPHSDRVGQLGSDFR